MVTNVSTLLHFCFHATSIKITQKTLENGLKPLEKNPGKPWKTLEIFFGISSGHPVHLRHYRTLDIYSTTAQHIVESLLGQFDDDAIDYKKTLISTMTDGCNTMQGSISGIKKHLSDKIPQFIDFGSCNDHHIANGLKHGVSEYDTDIQQALVNVYMDIGVPKGKGLKKKKEFEEVCSSIGLTPQPFKKFCSTRFRIIRECIKPVLSNWDVIVLYYSQVTKPTER